MNASPAADMDEYLAGFDARHANDTYTTPDSYIAACPRPALARLIAAYSRYLDEGIAATDGHFIPLDFEAWKASRTTELPPTEAWDTLPPRPKDRYPFGKRYSKFNNSQRTRRQRGR
ncbi:hypothetical protein FNV58_01075 (plasmid) [Streptomyces sp. RLB1-9]|uniref:hypothetical protein n=1 Tax=Streptomyces sp. RLB1-9 TaxID=2594454 RepID=UPI0011621272|nr:hypothetical protein [Streptomyces sp. RLB1-9]QDN94953.1 hypothetical protein FNV58_01075 [Streptomyces sp. RLB1-9]